MTERGLPVILAAKDLKYLHDADDLAQKDYHMIAEGAKQSFIFDQLMEGWAGFFGSQQSAPKPVPAGNHGL